MGLETGEGGGRGGHGPEQYYLAVIFIHTKQ